MATTVSRREVGPGPLRPEVRTLLEATGLIGVFELAEGAGGVGGADPQEVRA
jgi:hypothetical protein